MFWQALIDTDGRLCRARSVAGLVIRSTVGQQQNEQDDDVRAAARRQYNGVRSSTRLRLPRTSESQFDWGRRSVVAQLHGSNALNRSSSRCAYFRPRNRSEARVFLLALSVCLSVCVFPSDNSKKDWSWSHEIRYTPGTRWGADI